MPTAQQGNNISDSAQINPGVIQGSDIADGTIEAADIASGAVGTAEIEDGAVADADMASHETTKITVPLGQLTASGQTRGDIIFRGASAWQRLAAGTAGRFLKTNSTTGDPEWAAIAAYDAIWWICADTPTQPSNGQIAIPGRQGWTSSANAYAGFIAPYAGTAKTLITINSGGTTETVSADVAFVAGDILRFGFDDSPADSRQVYLEKNGSETALKFAASGSRGTTYHSIALLVQPS